MELNLREGYAKIDDIKIEIENFSKVEYVNVVFKHINMTFLYAKDINDFFFYSDKLAYFELLKLIAVNPKDVEMILRTYQYDYSMEHQLWHQLLIDTLDNFKLLHYRQIDGVCLNAYLGYFSSLPKKVKNIEIIYDMLISILPENIKKTYQQKAESLLQKVTNICGSAFEKREDYISQLEIENHNNIDKWNATKKYLKSLQSDLEFFIDEQVYDSVYVEKIHSFFSYSLVYINDKIKRLQEQELMRQYGSINHLKKALREDINKMGFMELLELFKEYKNQETYLCSKARKDGFDSKKPPYKDYIDIYRLGSVLISDKMNKLNKNKTKNKHIPQDLLDEALVFYYEADTIQGAYAVRSDEKYSQDKESGDKGERKVEYALKWLDGSFTQIEKKSSDRVGDACIFISNPDFIDERQEYDHIIVSNCAVFNIETKNYAGKLIIDKYGNWIRKKNDTEEGIKNPLQQIRQHEKILASFLPKECKIVSIICIANDKAILEGIENCPIPIVKSDMLVEFIENWKGSDFEMTEVQKKESIDAIYNHMEI